MTPIILRRNYRITDAEMLERAKTCRLYFEEDKADFTAFAAPFADPYSPDWLALIAVAEAELSDESIVDVQVGLTDVVESFMVDSRKHYQDIKFFIERAYPENLAIQNEFGADDYDTARQSQAKMLGFLKQLHHTAEKYKVDLIAAGYDQPRIDEIATLKDRLDTSNQEQEQYKGNRGVLTQERVDKNNAVWAIFKEVCKAGKRVYVDDYAKYQRYLLPASEEVHVGLSISGTVLKLGTLLPLMGVEITIVELGVTTTSDGLGVYAFGGTLPAGNYTLRATLAGYNLYEVAFELNDEHDVVNVNMVETV